MGHSIPPAADDRPADGSHTTPGGDARLQRILERHSRWLAEAERSKEVGREPPATFSGRQLAEKNLTGADLRRARLSGVVFAGTDLTGARLAGADLTGADLRQARGLTSCQLAGTNLAHARMPDGVGFEKTLETVDAASRSARPLMFGLLAACLYSALTVSATDDVGLLTNSSAEALPIIDAVVPVAWFLVLVPALLLAVHLYFHIYLQRLLESLAELPAVFPDGRPLDRQAHPWLLNGLVRSHCAVLRNEDPPPLSWLQNKLSMFLGWWVVPLTMGLFWFRYLSRHEWWGTGIQIFLLVVALTSAADFHSLARLTLRHADCDRAKGWRWLIEGPRKWILAAAPVLAVGLWLFSDGAIYGVWPDLHQVKGAFEETPQEESDEVEYAYAEGSPATEGGPPPAPVREMRPVPQLPPEDGLAMGERVRSPIMARLRQWIPNILAAERLQARVMFSDQDAQGAHLEHADLRYAFMSGTDLRGAHLNGVLLQHTFLTHVDLRGAELDGASLNFARLRDTDLREADLNGASLFSAKFRDTDLRGADLTGADFRKAELADVRLEDAILSEANLQAAGFQRALLAGAEVKTTKAAKATFVEADLRCTDFNHGDLRRANLDGAQLQCAELKYTRLYGISLVAADLRCATLTDLDMSPIESAPATGDDIEARQLARLKDARNWEKALYSQRQGELLGVATDLWESSCMLSTDGTKRDFCDLYCSELGLEATPEQTREVPNETG